MQNLQPAEQSFRRDINGLRAWAVASVVLFHFGIPGFAGGFVGVDVFFVISGFLMTGIVLRGLERANFSLVKFYLARARRILPALIALSATLLVLGWFFLLPVDYRNLATHVLTSIGFVSNFKYWTEAGYFDAASHDKWLLHTWSLSVEWQFYMLLPLCMLLVWRLRPGRRAQGVLLLVMFLVSLCLSIWDTQVAPSRAFFLLHTRAWELVAGGLCLFLPAPGTAARRTVLETAGMGMIIVSVLGFDGHVAWPGALATLPVLGTMLVLTAARRSPWTGSAAAQWLGTRSYSLYLWHWPAVVVLFYTELQSNPLAVAASVSAVLALADASYRWVEAPVRHGGAVQRAHAMPYALLAGCAAAGVAAMAVRQMDGWTGRMPAAINAVAKEAGNVNPRRGECHPHRGDRSPSCVYGGPDWKAIVLGDSHGAAVMTAMQQALPDPASGVVQWTYSGCAFIPGLADTTPQPAGYQCEAFRSWVLQRLADVPASVPVVLVSRYTDMAPGHAATNQRSLLSTLFTPGQQPDPQQGIGRRLTETACLLAKTRRVYMLRPIPEYGISVPQALARRMAWGLHHAQVSASRMKYSADYAWVNAAIDSASVQCGVVALDPAPYLCDASLCYGSMEDMPLYHDDDHLSERGNKRLVPLFRTVFGAPPPSPAGQRQ
jgi:peptidoglycan/LPS O-acetylase OafA/YrhL